MAQLSVSVNTNVVTDSGVYTTDSNLNTVVGAGACCVATACVGGVIINAAAGSLLGTVYYAGLAAMAGATGYGAFVDNNVSLA